MKDQQGNIISDNNDTAEHFRDYTRVYTKPHQELRTRLSASQAHFYKLFTQILTNRLDNKFHIYQPVEPAGFTKGFRSVDNLQTIRKLIEKTTESNISLRLELIDKGLEQWTMLDSRYINLLKNISENAGFHIQINKDLKTAKQKCMSER